MTTQPNPIAHVAEDGRVHPPGRHVVFDVETTGLYPHRGHRIIEIGALGIEGGQAISEFHSLVNIGKRIPLSVQRIHGITNEMLADQPSSAEVMSEFKKFIRSNTLVAHNAKFDMGFISREFLRLGMGLSNPYHCTLELSRSLYPRLRNHKLETVYRHLFGKLPEQIMRHRALDDARLVARIWQEMMKK